MKNEHLHLLCLGLKYRRSSFFYEIKKILNILPPFSEVTQHNLWQHLHSQILIRSQTFQPASDHKYYLSWWNHSHINTVPQKRTTIKITVVCNEQFLQSIARESMDKSCLLNQFFSHCGGLWWNIVKNSHWLEMLRSEAVIRTM